MLKIKNITKKYNTKKGVKCALDNVDITLNEGIYALLGPNGAGKSTLMKLITCNLKADEGTITWGEEEMDIYKLGAVYRSLLGYAPQQQGLYETLSGYRFLKYMCALKGIKKEEQSTEIDRVSESVNLKDVIKNRINSYSGGMKQRLLVAQALLGNPKLLIFDEPTVGLDPNERVRIREYIKSISVGKVVLIATHVVSDVESIADEVIIIKSGNIIEKSAVDELCKKYDVKGLEQVYVKIFDTKTEEKEEK